MRGLTAAAIAALMLPTAATASEVGEQLAQRLYDGTLAESREAAVASCEQQNADACFAAGLTELIGGVEALSQALYRHGATTPGTPAAAMLLGIDTDGPSGPANPDPEPLSYERLRDILGAFVIALDSARDYFERADGDAFVVTIDPLRVRIDLDGNGQAEAGETLGAMMGSVGEMVDIPAPDGPPPGGKSKTKDAEPGESSAIGFDNADAIWFAGYTQVVAAPVDLMLAHDFSEFFNAYLHRVFPKAGLPMQDYSQGSTLFMDPDSDAFIADIIAAIHTADFPVTDSERLAGVLERLKSVVALSRHNWELILAETDDNHELVPSPSQTSLVPGTPVTQETVDAWMATLDTVDQILAGDLLVPHWRFRQGFDLKAYFETATETDIVMLIAGQGALPYIKAGPIADARSFAEANRVFGTDWLNYAFWFN